MKCYVDSIQAKCSPSVMILDVEPPREQIELLDMTKKFWYQRDDISVLE